MSNQRQQGQSQDQQSNPGRVKLEVRHKPPN